MDDEENMNMQSVVLIACSCVVEKLGRWDWRQFRPIIYAQFLFRLQLLVREPGGSLHTCINRILDGAFDRIFDIFMIALLITSNIAFDYVLATGP